MMTSLLAFTLESRGVFLLRKAIDLLPVEDQVELLSILADSEKGLTEETRRELRKLALR